VIQWAVEVLEFSIKRDSQEFEVVVTPFALLLAFSLLPVMSTLLTHLFKGLSLSFSAMSLSSEFPVSVFHSITISNPTTNKKQQKGVPFVSKWTKMVKALADLSPFIVYFGSMLLYFSGSENSLKLYGPYSVGSKGHYCLNIRNFLMYDG